MRILLVNWQDLDNPEAGGAEIHLFELFSRMVAAGHQVDMVCSGWAGGSSHAVVRGLTVERVGGRLSFAYRGRGAVRAALRRAQYDVLVEDINKLPLYLARLTPIPSCVIVPHLFGTAAFHEASWPMATAVVAAEQLIPWAYRSSFFHAISESTRDDLMTRGVPADRIAVIHPGVDPVKFAIGAQVDRTTPPSFLFIGRLKRYKGVEIALRALALVRQTRADVTLNVAGSGDDRPRLEALAASLGLEGAVRFLGFVDDTTKIALLRSTWANLFPSPKEGWGITVMEAAGCGTPSIASDSPGLRDSVRRDRTGFLVPHGDVPSLAERMLHLASDRALVDRLGAAARAEAERWTWDDAADATFRHLENIVRQSGNQRS